MNVNKIFETLNFENLKKGSLVLLSLAKENQAEVLTGIAMAAVPAAVVATVKATRKADEVIKKASEESEEALDVKTKTAVAGKYYIVPVLLAVLAMGCTYASNYKSREKYAALAAVLAISETQNKDLLEQIEKLLGKEKKDEIVDGTIRDRIDKDHNMETRPATSKEQKVCLANNGAKLHFVDYYGNEWDASLKTFEEAVRELNYDFIHDGIACYSIGDFVSMAGLTDDDRLTEASLNIGWNRDEMYDNMPIEVDNPIEIKYEPRLDENTGALYMFVKYDTEPSPWFLYY